MSNSVLEALGGVGLFLLGMIVMTEGLRALTGRALRRLLRKFTKSPVTGAVTGAVTTAAVQSSSATTVAAVGFVSAGLMTFPQALGVIFGANVGTTVTGWLVAVLGFKFDIGSFALSLVFVGVTLRLFASKRLARVGSALAGFGLVFVGIDVLQEGMSGLPERFTPDMLPGDTIGGRVLLVLIGVAITVATQSSSAGVVMAMAAIHSGNISYGQAAAMVIGMDVGTTFTAAAASIGGSVDARRTGYAHVIYNLMTAVGAFFLLPVFVVVCDSADRHFLVDDPELGLAMFHSSFNLLGTLLVLPFTGRFASWIVRLVPATRESLTRRLNRSLLKDAEAARAATADTLKDIASETLKMLWEVLRGNAPIPDEDIELIDRALYEVRQFQERCSTQYDPALGADGEGFAFDASSVHVMDHLTRVTRRCQRGGALFAGVIDPDIASIRDSLAAEIDRLRCALDATESLEEHEVAIGLVWQQLDREGHSHRTRIIRDHVQAGGDLEEAIAALDTIRWLKRNAHHCSRILHHLRVMQE